MAVGLALALVCSGVAQAKVYVAGQAKDHMPGKCTAKDCTLREALIAANARAGRDKIELTRKRYVLKRTPTGSDDATTGDLNITDPVAITGQSKKLATIDANHIDRAIFQNAAVSPEHYTKLKRVAIVNGNSPGLGGGIEIGSGLLGLDHSRVSGNVAALDGGGIYATSGELTLTDSTISGNRAGLQGGGVWEAVETKVTGSTISGNVAASPDTTGTGGGGLVALGQLTMTNSTVANNKSATEAGGLDLFAPARLNGVTVSANVSNSDGTGSGPAGGIFQHSGEVIVTNSIVDGNSFGAGGSAPDCRGNFASEGNNLVHPTIGCDGFGVAGDILDLEDDPRISALASNGGPTKTMALKASSPAVGNASKATSAKRDQRGYGRDKHPDIGAYELGAKP